MGSCLGKNQSSVESTSVQRLTGADIENAENEDERTAQSGGTLPRISNVPRVFPTETGKNTAATASNGDISDRATTPLEGVGGGTGASGGKALLKWKKGEQIGSGNYGRVYVCLNEETGSLMAVKELKVQRHNWKELNALQMEVELMSSLQHSHIVRYLGTQAVPEQDILYIFTEWVPGGSLASMLRKFGCLPEPVIAKYTRQILLGLDYLHKNRVIHRDIKGANVLVDDRGTIKLADFGASKRISGLTEMDNQSLRGTPYYMAPEVIRQTGHGCPADIWSVGCTVFQMAMGQPPWKSLNFGSATALMFHIANTTSPPPIPSQLSMQLRDFLLLCMERDPQVRPTAEQLIKHAFVAAAGSGEAPSNTSQEQHTEVSVPGTTTTLDSQPEHISMKSNGPLQEGLNTTADLSDAKQTTSQFQKHWSDDPGQDPNHKNDKMTTTLSFTQANHNINIDTGKLSGGDDHDGSHTTSENGQDPQEDYSLPGQSVRTPPKKGKGKKGSLNIHSECDEHTISTYLKEKMEQTMQDLLSLQSEVNTYTRPHPSATLPSNTRPYGDGYQRGRDKDYTSGASVSPTHVSLVHRGYQNQNPQSQNGFAWTSPMEDALIQTTKYSQLHPGKAQEAPIRTQYTSQMLEQKRQEEAYRQTVETKKRDKQQQWEAELKAELDNQRNGLR